MVLAGCDVQAKFVCASCTHSWSTYDIIAWQDTKLFDSIEVLKELPKKYFIIGDEAFTCTEQFLSPWPGMQMHAVVVWLLNLINNLFALISGCGLDCYKDSLKPGVLQDVALAHCLHSFSEPNSSMSASCCPECLYCINIWLRFFHMSAHWDLIYSGPLMIFFKARIVGSSSFVNIARKVHSKAWAW